MRVSGLIAAPVLLIAGSATSQPTPSALEREILAVETARLAAFRDNDRAAFARMVTDDLQMVHGDGVVLDKAAEIGVMRPSTPERPLPTLNIEDTRVRGSGNLASMTGSLVERRDGKLLFRLRFTNVYVRTGGRWLLASGQLTRARVD